MNIKNLDLASRKTELLRLLVVHCFVVRIFDLRIEIVFKIRNNKRLVAVIILFYVMFSSRKSLGSFEFG